MHREMDSFLAAPWGKPCSPTETDSKRTTAGRLTLYLLSRLRTACFCDRQPSLLKRLVDVPASRSLEGCAFPDLFKERLLDGGKDMPGGVVNDLIRYLGRSTSL
jgi:hypothetical protein